MQIPNDFTQVQEILLYVILVVCNNICPYQVNKC